MSFANHIVSTTDIKLVDIANALNESLPTGLKIDVTSNLRMGDVCDPHEHFPNIWSRNKPAKSTADFGFNIVRRTTASGIVNNWNSDWAYKPVTANFRMGDYAGYYSQASSFVQAFMFPSSMKKGTAYSNQIAIVIDDTCDRTKEISYKDITKTSGGTTINLGNMYPGYIMTDGTRYFFKCVSNTVSAASDTLQAFPISYSTTGTNYTNLTAGNWDVYPVLFEGTPSQAMTGTSYGATNTTGALPSGITAIIALPTARKVCNIYGTTMPTTGSVIVNYIACFKNGTRTNFEVHLILQNPTPDPISSWSVAGGTISDSNNSVNVNAQTITMSVASQTTEYYTLTVPTTLLWGYEKEFSVAAFGVNRTITSPSNDPTKY